MRKLSTMILLGLSITGCQQEHELNSRKTELTAAIVRDIREFGGSCTFVFELEDGSQLEPVFPPDCCSTSAALEEGKQVWISFENVKKGNTCIFGPVVRIKELKEN